MDLENIYTVSGFLDSDKRCHGCLLPCNTPDGTRICSKKMIVMEQYSLSYDCFFDPIPQRVMKVKKIPFPSQYVSKGLNDAQVAVNLSIHGSNELSGDSGPSIWKLLFTNIVNSMNLILFTALVVSISVLDWIKFTVLLFVIVTNSSIGFFQEYKSEKTMDALKKMSSPTANVLRNSEWNFIAAKDLVPGDIISIKMGDVCPSDIRLIEVNALEMDEAFLTGESIAIPKIIEPLSNKNEDFVNVGDRINCAFMNSTVIRGRGVGIVIGTGFQTEVGKIATLVLETKDNEKTPLMKSLDRIMYSCACIALVLGVVVFASDRFVWSTDTFLYAISVGIAILPEGLPAVITVVLAIGLRSMSKQKALIRQLSALEAIGQITNICSDKTGTLTEGKMVVKDFWIDGIHYTVNGSPLDSQGTITEKENGKEITKQDVVGPLDIFFKVAALCNNSKVTIDPSSSTLKSFGDPTEIALRVLGIKAQLTMEYYEHQEGLVFEQEFGFESSLKRMTKIYRSREGLYYVFTKGAFEHIIERSTRIIENQAPVELTKQRKNHLQDIIESYAGKGMRILVLAYKTSEFYSQKVDRAEVESELIILGMCAIYDPPRAESLNSVLECHRAGISVHMATGDHPKTAEAIAREVGILSPNDAPGPPLVLPAHVFESMTDAEIDEMPELPRVLARCAPTSKVTLINALHRRNLYVAMTGDGVNDAPAVKKADIGIAMGLGGSDVTKQASSITLTDDNFQTIVVAIREGRRLFQNITNIVQHLLSGNVSEVIVLVIGLALRDVEGHAVFPMSAIQILWLNMVTSSPVALCLGVEPYTKDIMLQPPRKKDQNLSNFELNMDLMFYGTTLGMFSLGSFMLYIHYSVGLSNMPTGCAKKYIPVICDPIYSARAISFVSLSLLILVHGFNCRNNRISMTKYETVNKPLLYAIVFGFFSTIPTTFIPGMNLYMFEQLGFNAIWWVVLAGEIILFVMISELYKYCKRRYYAKKVVSDSSSIPLTVLIQ